jgi:hypothetical protein
MSEEKKPLAPPSPTVSHDEDLNRSEGSTSGSDSAPYAEHGPGIDHKIPQEEAVQEGRDLLWSRIRHFMREPFSEFLGCFILILFGDGVVAQVGFLLISMMVVNNSIRLFLVMGKRAHINQYLGDGGEFPSLAAKYPLLICSVGLVSC